MDQGHSRGNILRSIRWGRKRAVAFALVLNSRSPRGLGATTEAAWKSVADGPAPCRIVMSGDWFELVLHVVQAGSFIQLSTSQMTCRYTVAAVI